MISTSVAPPAVVNVRTTLETAGRQASDLAVLAKTGQTPDQAVPPGLLSNASAMVDTLSGAITASLDIDDAAARHRLSDPQGGAISVARDVAQRAVGSAQFGNKEEMLGRMYLDGEQQEIAITNAVLAMDDVVKFANETGGAIKQAIDALGA